MELKLKHSYDSRAGGTAGNEQTPDTKPQYRIENPSLPVAELADKVNEGAQSTR